MHYFSRQAFVVGEALLPDAVKKAMERGEEHDKAERRAIMAAVYEQYTKSCRSRYYQL